MADNEYRGLMVLLPTRNRSGLAIRAIRSVLAAGRGDVRLLVSDNSTVAVEEERLRTYCEGLDDRRVQYVRPPEPLAMSPHWEWAFDRALAGDPANHLTVLGDRRIFRRGGLDEVVNIIQKNNKDIIIYDQLMVADHKLPITVWGRPWTGNLFEIAARDLLRGNASGAWHAFVPVLQNSVVTREALGRVMERFGNWFLSVSPDFVFGFRSLNVVDRVLLYDKPVILGSALGRSNGFSFSRGVKTPDNVDFFRTNPQLERGFDETPVPAIMTANNATYHEYGFVSREARDGLMPPIDKKNYMNIIAREVESIVEDPRLRRSYLELLVEHGYRQTTREPATEANPQGSERAEGPGSGVAPLPSRLVRSLMHPATLPRKVLRRLPRRIFDRPAFWGLWRLLADRLALPIPEWATPHTRHFHSTDAALKYLNRVDVNRVGHPWSLGNTMPAGLFREPPFRPVDL